MERLSNISKEELVNWIRVPLDFIDKARTDPAIFARDIANVPTKAIVPFFRNRDSIFDSIDVDLWNPFIKGECMLEDSWKVEDSASRYIHIDLAKNRDNAGICCCHLADWKEVIRVDAKNTKEKVWAPIIEVDYMGVESAKEGEEIEISKFVRLVEETADRGAYVELVTFDFYGSNQAIQLLRELGFTAGVMSIDRCTYWLEINSKANFGFTKVSTDGDYAAPMDALRIAMLEKRFRCPENDLFIEECFSMEWHEDKRMAIKIEGATDDLIQPVAGALFSLTKNEIKLVIDHTSSVPSKGDIKQIEMEKDFGEMGTSHYKDVDTFINEERKKRGY